MIKNTYLDGETHLIDTDSNAWIMLKNNGDILYCISDWDNKDQSLWDGNFNLLYPIQKHNASLYNKLEKIIDYYDIVIDEAVITQDGFQDKWRQYDRSV